MSSIRITTRREFLAQGLGVIGVGAALPNFLVRTALAGPPAKAGERILVVLQLSGGHDGLSAVVPYCNDDYLKNREDVRIGAGEVLKVNDDFGLHPNLKELKNLLEQGQFATVLGVGYPNHNRSHFTSMDIWHQADRTRRSTYGWIGRYADQAFQGRQDPLLTLSVGGGDKAPRAVQGKEHPGISLSRPEAYRLLAGRADPKLAEAYRRLNQQTAEAATADNLQFIARTAVDANSSSDAIQRIAGARKSSVTYPTTALGTSLGTVANLIASNLSTRVYYVFQGGFDTHANQRARHNALMAELDGAVAAFQKDLAAQGNAERVLTVSFSEFGRTLKENRSRGTDHGTAAPMFLFGPAVKAGIHGRLQSLAAADLVNREPVCTVDFRAVYATVLEKWLGTSSATILGEKYSLLDCVKA